MNRYYLCERDFKKFLFSVFLGPRANKHRLSCVCLHSDRSPDERQRNLERFKSNEVRFLICTDVAARGIDVRGLPFGKKLKQSVEFHLTLYDFIV